MAGSVRSTRRPARSCGRSSLGGAANATPSTYLGKDGKQYVVITSTGGGFFGATLTDDSIMAFALRGSN
jgi:quinoprotein glucose dehydrogenase